MNVIKIFLGSCIIKMSNQIHRQTKQTEKEILFALLNLIHEEGEIWEYDAKEKLKLSERQMVKAKRNLKARFSYEILIKNQKFKVIPIQETLV